jgi:hypothetical protein
VASDAVIEAHGGYGYNAGLGGSGGVIVIDGDLVSKLTMA